MRQHPYPDRVWYISFVMATNQDQNNNNSKKKKENLSSFEPQHGVHNRKAAIEIYIQVIL